MFGGAKPVPIDRRNLRGGAWGMALVAVAGPLMNFLLALVAFLIGHASGLLYDNGFLGSVVMQIIMTNLGFFLFNMIPIPPLDGSRILYAVAPDGVNGIRNRPGGGICASLLFFAIFVSIFNRGNAGNY